ncbi:hypothetical protein [Cupriavidus sp. Agwp_2]|uniref:IS66 family insertion sequence element accessory protein TnpA n=1 Tax=Cupriavidus sp. Agwp_2 TaxID=2897324 RepID=UPI0034613A65
MLAQWHDSGLSIRAFCRQQGLAVSTFGLWRKRVERERPAVAPLTVTAETAFIAAGTSAAASATLPLSDTGGVTR